MMQDIDGVSRYIDPLIHRYTITASRLHAEDVTERPFACSYDVFHSCNNPRHVTPSDTLSISITIATHPSIPTLYYTSIKFSTIFSIRPVLPIEPRSTDCNPLPIPGDPSPSITLIPFDLVINSLAPLLLGQGHNALQHILCESDQFFSSLATQVSPDTAISLTPFEHTLSSLQHRLSFLSTTISPASHLLPNKFASQPALSFPLISNPTNNTVSHPTVPNGNFDIVPNGNFDSDNPVPNGKPNSNTDLFNLVPNGIFDIVPNGNINSDNPVPNGKSNSNTDLFNLVPNGILDIVPNGNFDSDNSVPNGNVVSHSITPPDNIVTYSVVDKSNLSFPSASIRTVNGIDFTFHSHLYFDLQRWISSLLPLLRLLISSFQLDCFYSSAVMIPLVYRPTTIFDYP